MFRNGIRRNGNRWSDFSEARLWPTSEWPRNPKVGHSSPNSYLQTVQRPVGRGMHISTAQKDEDHRLFLTKIRLNLRSVGGNGGDVCNVIAFLERWDRVDVQDDTGDRSAGFEYDLAEIVGDKADFHALLNIATALHKRVPNAGAIGQDIHDSVEPDRILDRPRVS